MAIDFAGDVAAILSAADMPSVSITYAQDLNSKAITNGWRLAPLERDDTTLTESGSVFVVPASEFTSGFSVSSPVTPSPGDSVSVAGEDVWRVQGASLTAAGNLWEITAGKRSQRGTL